MHTGDSTYLEDALLPMHRHGYTEECYFNYTFTADSRGRRGVDGVFNAVIETTYRVVSERRTRLLERLGEATGRVRLIPDACRAAADVLAAEGNDAPFCLVYLVDAEAAEASLAAAAGVSERRRGRRRARATRGEPPLAHRRGPRPAPGAARRRLTA